jgi:2-methylcitrate dehydratase PrpD
LELTAQQTANALGLACALTAGTNQSWISGSDEWLIEVGMAARSGVDAAGLTAAGAAAAPDAFEGQAGWSTAFFDDPGASRLTDALGASFTLADSVAVKPYPVSGIAQPMTWLAARAHHRLAGRGFQRAVVHISAAESDYPGSMNRGPFDARGQALMSVAYCVACALSAGYVQVRQLEDPESVAALIDRVEIVPDAGLAELDATVTVLADDGEEIVLKDNGRELLFLDPDTVDPAEIARRSEAPVSAVERAWQELTRDQPDARVLAEIVGAA